MQVWDIVQKGIGSAPCKAEYCLISLAADRMVQRYSVLSAKLETGMDGTEAEMMSMLTPSVPA